GAAEVGGGAGSVAEAEAGEGGRAVGEGVLRGEALGAEEGVEGALAVAALDAVAAGEEPEVGVVRPRRDSGGHEADAAVAVSGAGVARRALAEAGRAVGEAGAERADEEAVGAVEVARGRRARAAGRQEVAQVP